MHATGVQLATAKQPVAMQRLFIGVLLLCTSTTLAKTPIDWDRVLVIAHRGTSGALPEQTVEAYQQGVLDGADFIECDLVMSKDCKLLCRHEPWLDLTSDAAEKFPELMRSSVVDGNNVTGVFSTDLTLEQIKTLRGRQPNGWDRDPNYANMFRIATFEDYMDIALGADRVVGIIPEIKHATWHDTQDLECLLGTSMTEIAAKAMEARGYTGPHMSEEFKKQPGYIQSFEVGNLKDISSKTKIPLVQLVNNVARTIPDTGELYATLMTPEGIKEVATYAAIYSPWKSNIIPWTADRRVNRTAIRADVIKQVHDAGMAVSFWTFRNEARFLAWDYETDLWQEYDLFFKELDLKGGDSLFTCFPKSLKRYMQYSERIKPASTGSMNFQVLPEHTVEAFQLGVDSGADFIECDVVITKDLVPICRHEPELARSTDAYQVLGASYNKSYVIDGRNESGIFSFDVTYDDVKKLRAIQPYDYRDAGYNGKYKVASLKEFLQVALNSSERVIGVYIETKHPTFFNNLQVVKDAKTSMDAIINKVLQEAGYNTKATLCSDSWNDKPVFIQSFEVSNLRDYWAKNTDLPLVFLVDDVTPDTGLPWQEQMSDKHLDEIRLFADGIGPWKNYLMSPNRLGHMTPNSGLDARITSRGFMNHPYTFRNEDRHLMWSWEIDPYEEYEYFLTRSAVDGIFTDFPRTMARYIDSMRAKNYTFSFPHWPQGCQCSWNHPPSVNAQPGTNNTSTGVPPPTATGPGLAFWIIVAVVVTVGVLAVVYRFVLRPRFEKRLMAQVSSDRGFIADTEEGKALKSRT